MAGMESLRGRVAIVTGGGTGIGHAIADGLAALGVELVLVGRRAAVLEAAADRLRASRGTRVEVVPGDVREQATLEAALTTASGILGRLDLLVNNAGGQFVAPAELISRKGWTAVVDIALNATFLWSQAAARHWIAETRGGTILNLVGPFRDRATPGMAHSGAARAAVVQLARSLAVEWAPFGIRVNNLGPAVLTEGMRSEFASDRGDVVGELERRRPSGRWATLEEVADLACFLASDMAASISGETIVIDGSLWQGEGLWMRALSDRRWVNEPESAGRRDWPSHLLWPEVGR